MPRLIIQLLGSFRVTKDDQPVAFTYDKVSALLAYLAVESAVPISRVRLSSLLWPDQPQTAAQDSLRQALSRLRSLIDDRDALPPFLLIERESLQINRASSLQIDLDLFQSSLSVSAAHHHRSLTACSTCVPQLEQAARLVRGEFLEDLSVPDSDLFETWATTWRERIKIQALELFGVLAQAASQRAETETALAYAARQIAIDPYHEAAHRQMMLALVRSGQRSQAVLHFNRLKQMLAAELDILPGAETLALFERIRQGDPLPDPLPPRVRNLPVPLTALVGRAVELSELMVWLSDPSRRLISILGPGGVGKTRLVVQAAQQAAGLFAAGVVYVPFTPGGEPVAPPSLINGPITEAFGLPAGDSSWAQVQHMLRSQELLLIFDGFEHVFAGRERISELLEANERLVVLTTTRQRLDLPGEWVFGLGGLDIPPQSMDHQLEAYSAATLFCQCARQANPSFELNDTNRASIGAICRLVAGLPLALRLAAAWARSLPSAEIAAEIQRGLDILSHQVAATSEPRDSIRAVFNQSWERLAPIDREVFARLSIFRGGFDRASALSIAGAAAETLAHLVDASLIRRALEDRYDLHDLLLQFGAEKLPAGPDAAAVRQRHFEWFYAQAEQNERLLTGGGTLKAFIWLIHEAANLREALTWAQTHAPTQAAQLATWMHTNYHQWGTHLLGKLG